MVADFAASFTEEVITPGEVTYKIFPNYTNPLDKQLAVSGNANFSALQLSASSPLIQSTWCQQFLPTSLVLWLSRRLWVTIGEGVANGGETQFSRLKARRRFRLIKVTPASRQRWLL